MIEISTEKKKEKKREKDMRFERTIRMTQREQSTTDKT